MEQKYTQRLEKIETELKRWLPDEADSAWAEKVFPGIGKRLNEEAIRSLITPLNDILSRGGKRWRPLFMTLVCETFGGGDSAIPLTPLLEFSHNASLIHDDIEDDSDERRGKPAVHRIYGIDTAINLGSFFYFLSTSCIDTCEIKDKDIIYRLWTDCMRKLHLGQSIDINWHRNISLVPNIEEYYLMAAMKTGSLARLAAELGALAAGASPQAVQVMGDAAERMGVGFQILDDVKNLTTGIPGKRRGDDVVEGKKGLPILMYLNKYPEKHGMVFYCLHIAKTDGYAAPEVEDLINTLSDAGVFEEAKEKGISLLKEPQEIFASHDFAGCNVNESGRDLLNGFIKLIS